MQFMNSPCSCVQSFYPIIGLFSFIEYIFWNSVSLPSAYSLFSCKSLLSYGANFSVISYYSYNILQVCLNSSITSKSWGAEPLSGFIKQLFDWFENFIVCSYLVEMKNITASPSQWIEVCLFVFKSILKRENSSFRSPYLFSSARYTYLPHHSSLCSPSKNIPMNNYIYYNLYIIVFLFLQPNKMSLIFWSKPVLSCLWFLANGVCLRELWLL